MPQIQKLTDWASLRSVLEHTLRRMVRSLGKCKKWTSQLFCT